MTRYDTRVSIVMTTSDWENKFQIMPDLDFTCPKNTMGDNLILVAVVKLIRPSCPLL